jgi:cytochrome b6-f complex iron-sulfur subunit
MSECTVHQNLQPAGEPVSRQIFLRVILGGAGAAYAAALGYPLYRYLASPAEKASLEAAVTEVMLKGAATLPKSSALMFRFGAKPGLLIHHADDTWTALSAVCTHLGCLVEYQADRDSIHCNCHGGEYDAETGANVAGPPPKPLERFVVKITGQNALISRT